MKGEASTLGKQDERPFVPREPAVREDFTETAFDLNMEMVYVEGGTFEMGATAEQQKYARDDEEPVRIIKLDGYHIGKYEVTQAQWEEVMGTNPAYFKGDNRPVECVSWEEAQEFCKRLSEKTGKRYVLPTEAQWEYAARGGNKSRHYTYAGSDNPDEVAWYAENKYDFGENDPKYGMRRVGMKKANELGIYDMSGNVLEWCSDWYAESYDENDTENPQGPSIGSDRVLRGGGWYYFFSCCRVSSRSGTTPDNCYGVLGFRVACCSKKDGENFTEKAFGLNMEMVYVEGGEFEMGATAEQGNDADDNEKPVRTIKMDGYHIGKYVVTQAQWEKVMGTTLEEQYSMATYDDGIVGKGSDFPMCYVSWEEAQAFCQKLSEATGRVYMLPTEAQWEYAARGGNKSRHYMYAGSDNPDEVAWSDENRYDCEKEPEGTHKVGMKNANELGIYDMSGNVWEWCSDWYAESYDENDTENPQGPSIGFFRAARGGSWCYGAVDCCVSHRGTGLPGSCYYSQGFRVVCIP